MYVVQVDYLHIGHLWVVGHILKADWSVGYSVVVATSKKHFLGAIKGVVCHQCRRAQPQLQL